MLNRFSCREAEYQSQTDGGDGYGKNRILRFENNKIDLSGKTNQVTKRRYGYDSDNIGMAHIHCNGDRSHRNGDFGLSFRHRSDQVVDAGRREMITEYLG